MVELFLTLLNNYPSLLLNCTTTIKYYYQILLYTALVLVSRETQKSTTWKKIRSLTQYYYQIITRDGGGHVSRETRTLVRPTPRAIPIPQHFLTTKHLKPRDFTTQNPSFCIQNPQNAQNHTLKTPKNAPKSPLHPSFQGKITL